MLRRARTAAALALAFLVLSCGGGGYEPPGPGEVELCTFDLEPGPRFRVTHQRYDGAMLAGDLDRKAYAEREIASIATAIAEPRQSTYSVNLRQDCYDETNKRWYPCRVKAEVDLRNIKGLARAAGLRDAERYAVQNCEQTTLDLASEALQRRRILSGDLECELVQSGFCDIPPP